MNNNLKFSKTKGGEPGNEAMCIYNYNICHVHVNIHVVQLQSKFYNFRSRVHTAD